MFTSFTAPTEARLGLNQWDGVGWGMASLLAMFQDWNFHQPRIFTSKCILSPSKETCRKLIFYSSYTAMLKSPTDSSRSASDRMAHSFENPQWWRSFVLQGGSEFVRVESRSEPSLMNKASDQTGNAILSMSEVQI